MLDVKELKQKEGRFAAWKDFYSEVWMKEVNVRAVKFIKLTREQQWDVIKRTFHERI